MWRGALVSLVVIGLVLACAGSARAAVPDRVALSELAPLPPASEAKVSPEARALRERLLGPRAADPRYVTLHWVGVSSFIVTVKGHLLLFDAWEIVGVHKDYLPLGREELAGLEPEAILIGHGHFDHAADAGYVAGRNGSVVLASQEQCDTVKEDAARDGNQGAFTCAITGSQATPAFGNLTQARLFADLPPVTVLKNVHSNARPPGNGNEPDQFVTVFDPKPYLENPNNSPEEVARFAETLGDEEGGTRMYQLRTGDFSLLLGDSAGPIFEQPAVRRALDSLPGCVDVMANAILGFDQPVSGLQDPVDYVEEAHPRVFLPTHADAWAPALSAGQAAYREELTSELGSSRTRPRWTTSSTRATISPSAPTGWTRIAGRSRWRAPRVPAPRHRSPLRDRGDAPRRARTTVHRRRRTVGRTPAVAASLRRPQWIAASSPSPVSTCARSPFRASGCSPWARAYTAAFTARARNRASECRDRRPSRSW